MTTISRIGNRADVAEITFDLSHTRPDPLDFLIEVVYPNSSVPTNYTEPEVSFNNGQTYVPVIDGAFTTAPNTRYIVFRFKLNNDNAIVTDNYVLARLSPGPGNTQITNSAPLEVSVEIIDSVALSTISLDSPTGIVLENDELVVDYTVTPALGVASSAIVALVPGTATLPEIGTLSYSTDGILYEPLPVDNEIQLPVGCGGFSVKIDTGHSSSFDNKTFVLRLTFVMTGTVLNKSVVITNTDNHPAGELISESCDGFNKMGLYHDGNGSTYIDMIEYRSAECGFLFPPSGEVLTVFCAGFDRYRHIADGNGGHTVELVEHNSTACNYVAPVVNTQTELTPTVWDVDTKGSSVILSDGERTYSGLERDGVRTEYSALFGKWYSEFTVYMPTAFHQAPSIGLVSAGHPMGNWIGSNEHSWAWWPHEGTKYHDDVQGFYGPEVHNGDTISLLYDNVNGTLSFWLNGVDLGVMYSNLPTTTKLYIAINALDESFAIANFGQNEFKYTPPVGYYPGFGVLFAPPIERDTDAGFTCVGVDKFKVYADGKFGTYTQLHETDSADCGYVPPPPVAGTILRTFCTGYNFYHEVADGAGGSNNTLIETNSSQCGYVPPLPAGTTVSYYCTGYNQYRVVADGNYGTYDELSEINSTSCGYVPPAGADFIPAKLDTNFYANNTTFSNGDKTAALESSVIATNYAYSGKWYWEITTTQPNIVVGVINTSGFTPTEIVGVTVKDFSYGWSISEQKTYANGTPTNRSGWPSISAGDRIGIYLDFVAQRITFLKNGTVVGVINNMEIDNYYPAISVLNGTTPSVTVYFDPAGIVGTPPAGFNKGFGNPNYYWPPKNSVYSQYCVDTTSMHTVADGAGGYYDIVHETNSPTCGWEPPAAYGTLLGYACHGTNNVDRYEVRADGNYGSYEVLLQVNSPGCGYLAAGQLISTYCDGFNMMGRYSDGNFGIYDDTIMLNSSDCGFGGTPPSSSMPYTAGSDLVFNPTQQNTLGDLIFKP